jgi:hypothetical protein
MKVNRVFLIATAAVVSAVAIPSCAYQPYYSEPSYSSGYGYGYGSRNFTTIHFVRTSSPRWGYDPYARCYYDYSRRCYYDPYLNGYYPAGYRPAYVYGAPHPHGWRTGHNYIAPPSRIHDHRLDNYQNRSERYRSLNTDWSRNVQNTSAPRSYNTNHNRYPSRDQSSGSRSGSIFGSSQPKPSTRTYDRSQNSYVSETQERSRPEPRMSAPKQESPRSPRQGSTYKEERNPRPEREASPRPGREASPSKERGGRKSEISTPEAMRQPEKRESQRVRSQENRRDQAPSNRSLELVKSVE